MITITGVSFSNGSDIYSVRLGEGVAQILEQDNDKIIARTLPLPVEVNISAPVLVEIASQSVGITRFPAAFTFYPGSCSNNVLLSEDFKLCNHTYILNQQPESLGLLTPPLSG